MKNMLMESVCLKMVEQSKQGQFLLVGEQHQSCTSTASTMV